VKPIRTGSEGKLDAACVWNEAAMH
jgi:hypothetical protein